MSTRNTSFAIEEFYHLYNRGNSKQKIFIDKTDYKRFVDLLYAVNSREKFNFSDSIKGIPVYEREQKKPLVAIGAYCLMPNHFHLLITPLVDNGVSKFMQKLSTGYSMYFNKKYKRVGGLFEGKFKSKYCDSDRYLKYVFSYIHLNPVKLLNPEWKEIGVNLKSAQKYLSDYKYSSYLDYIGIQREENLIVNKKPFPNYFPTKSSFTEDINQWISYRETL